MVTSVGIVFRSKAEQKVADAGYDPVRLPPGQPGRAEAVFERRSWAAKHYWADDDGVVIYEFDEPLPAGPVTLRIPFVPA